MNKVVKPLSSVRKFYLLDYFYVLLESVEKYSDREKIFEYFKDLKQKHGLGESKYRKLTSDETILTKVQLQKYRYTFEKVISESLEYDLIFLNEGKIFLTDFGKKLLYQYQSEGFKQFTISIFKLIESKYGAFRYIIELLNHMGKEKSGLFILPIYSPSQLEIDKKSIKTTKDIILYSKALTKKLEYDIQKYLNQKISLESENGKLLQSLMFEKLIENNETSVFDPINYNTIIARFRTYWLRYFLQEIYNYKYYLSSFEIWTYRAKQIGILHATEFYPYFNGKIVYPTSVIIKSTKSNDFKKIFEYSDGYSLYIHEPEIEPNQEHFVDSLVSAYFNLRKTNRNYFINLTALRELVCYQEKIPEYVFQDFLENVYHENLSGNLKIQISLEVDRLPEETKANYLKQEPVVVDGRVRNIIAIDVARGGL